MSGGPAGDTSTLVERIASLERQLENSKRFGTIAQVDPKLGYRVRWGDKVDGSNGWMGTEDWLSPWIQPGQHAGFSTENVPFEVGQQVLCNQLNEDGTQALIMPFAWSEAKPQDPNTKIDAATQRIAKPITEGTQGEPFKGTDFPKKEFSEEDLQITKKHDLFEVKMGNAVFRITPQGFTMKMGNTGVVITEGDVKWTR